MSLEAAAVAVGKAVGTHLAQIWLSGHAADQERGKNLVELTRVSFPDKIVRRRFDRQLEDIADQVAERLRDLCAVEYRGLGRGDKAAALYKVVQTLKAADLSDRALWSADMDAMRLADQVRGRLPNRGVDAELGEAGARLYEVVLDECCYCLVRIVQDLPRYGPRASTELLARTSGIAGQVSGIAEQVSLVLARLPARSLDAPEGTASDEEFRRRYLELIIVTLDVLELFGVRTERYRPRTTLSVAYISLSVSANGDDAARHRGRHDYLSSGRAPRIDEWRKDYREPDESTLRVESALGRSQLTLLRGEAGSGKSTLLNWLAISAARRNFTADLAAWNGCVPFLVKLRGYVGRPLPKPEQFLEGVADPIAGLMPAAWVHRELTGGHALLLVDGVDELPAAQRRAVRPWLSGLLAAYPGLRVVVTSRPAAAGSDWLAAEGFATAFLERMTPADVKELIRHWHDAIRNAGDLPCPAEELPGFEAALLARLESAPHLRALAGSPLLAAMLCALNLDRVKQLPRDRMGLYAAALELLLERRDAIRQIEVGREIVLDQRQKMQILQYLAWQLSVFGRTELPRDAVVHWTADKLAAMPSAPADGAEVLDYLLQRSGVLREPVPGRIDFVHRTVQEYLTAKQFTDDGDLEPLIGHAHQDQWRETIIMAAGHANSPQRTELLSGLLRRIAAEPRRARRLRLLVVGCLETLPSIPAGLRDDINACLDSLVPPRDLASARSLSSVGEPILDHLPRTPDGLTPAAARAVIRTAWLVNGPGALDVLAGYAQDPRNEVQRELVNGWEYFDADLYAQRVLADAPLPDGGSLRLPAARLLPALRHLTHLKELYTGHCRIDDLNFLRGLTQPISRLHINNLQSGDLSPLPSCSGNLENLSLSTRATVEDFGPLCRIPQLRYLTLGRAGIRNLNFVRNLPELSGLHLHGVVRAADLSPLLAQIALEDLCIGDCPALDTLDKLPPLYDLRYLNLSSSSLTSGMQDLVDRAPNLESLYVNFSQWVDNLAPLTSLNLRAFGLQHCKSIIDFTLLAGMTHLKHLDLEGTRISSLDPLGQLVNLETLWLRECVSVTDLAPLAPLRRLRHLYIGGVGSGIDLAPLTGNKNITVYIERGQDVRHRSLLGRRVIEW